MKEIVIQTQNSNREIVVKAEFAVDEASRMAGLMFRKNLGKNEAMIFLFPEDNLMPFWMHNTYLPLDIVFINRNHEIIYIAENAKPLSDDLIQPPSPYRYTLEVNAGFIAEHKIQVGDRVKF